MNNETLPGALPNVTTNIAKFLSRLDRAHIEAVAETAIALLDDMDGDLDVELNGDENDDPGDLQDAAWPEWDRRGKAKEAFMTANREGFAGPDGHVIRAELIEDTEIDDHGGGDDAEDDFELSRHARAARSDGAGCPISDPGGGAVDDQGERSEPHCGEYGLDQSHPMSATTAFIAIHEMGNKEIKAAIAPDLSFPCAKRIAERLSLNDRRGAVA
jgi:hypothetical protein